MHARCLRPVRGPMSASAVAVRNLRARRQLRSSGLMSVPTAELTAPAPPTDVAAPRRGLPEWVRGGRFYLWLAGAALLIGAVSLLIPSTPSYDPWAWLVWG